MAWGGSSMGECALTKTLDVCRLPLVLNIFLRVQCVLLTEPSVERWDPHAGLYCLALS